MLRSYFVYQPVSEGSIEEEWKQCLDQIVKNTREGFRPVKLNIFVSLPDYSSYIEAKTRIGDSVVKSLGENSPAFNVSVHPPGKPYQVIVEGLFVSSDTAAITTKFRNSVPFVVIETGSLKEVWGAGLGNDLLVDDTRKAAIDAFDRVVDILNSENLSLNHIVRQWNFIGNILEIKKGFQNYQIFNEVRSEYYARLRSVPGYPAATGVGMKLGGVFLDFCAVKADENIKIKAVNNPVQINAYEYGQEVLKGLTETGRSGKHPPQFERALLMMNKTAGTVFVSGTASIIGQETIGKGDIKEQTIVTVENIRKLTNIERISELAGRNDLIKGAYSLVRVYVKKQEDFGVVRDICSQHFPGAPAVFIEADICRDDLLTEIEAEFVIR